MKNSDTRHDLLTRSYVDHYRRVLGFIASRINCEEDAENLAQDVWLRLLEYDKALSEDSILSLIYTVASNLVNDYLRRLYRSRAAVEELRGFSGEADWSGESARTAVVIRTSASPKLVVKGWTVSYNLYHESLRQQECRRYRGRAVALFPYRRKSPQDGSSRCAHLHGRGHMTVQTPKTE